MWIYYAYDKHMWVTDSGLRRITQPFEGGGFRLEKRDSRPGPWSFHAVYQSVDAAKDAAGDL